MPLSDTWWHAPSCETRPGWFETEPNLLVTVGPWINYLAFLRLHPHSYLWSCQETCGKFHGWGIGHCSWHVNMDSVDSMPFGVFPQIGANTLYLLPSSCPSFCVWPQDSIGSSQKFFGQDSDVLPLDLVGAGHLGFPSSGQFNGA